jgi:uncharacterized membrane protein
VTAIAHEADPLPVVTSRTWRARLSVPVPITVLTTISLAYYIWHGFTEHFAYRTTGYDLGIFDQAIRAYAHFKAPMVPLKGAGYNIFGDHFHPIIATLAPLYWIWDDPLMLVIAQAALTAAAVPVVYRFTRRRAGEVISLVVAGAFAFGWPIQAMIDFDFHEIAFATPLLALAIDALDTRAYRRMLICSVLLLFVREDMGIVVLLLALLWILQRHRPWWPPAALAALGVITYFLVTSLVIPHFARGHGFAYGGQYDALGNSIGSAGLHVVLHPWTALKLLFSPIAKTAMLGYLLVPLAFLPLRSRYALLAVPLLLERLFNSRGNLWQPHFHYNALPWLVLVLAMVDAAARMNLFSSSWWLTRSLRWALTGWLVVFPFLLIVNPIPIKPTPINHFRDNQHDNIGPRVKAARAVVGYLPHDVCVDADNTLVPHLTVKDYVTLPHLGPTDADFVALDLNAHDVGNDGPKPRAVLAAVTKQGYTAVLQRQSWIVLRSPDYTGPSSACAPLGGGKPNP